MLFSGGKKTHLTLLKRGAAVLASLLYEKKTVTTLDQGLYFLYKHIIITGTISNYLLND